MFQRALVLNMEVTALQAARVLTATQVIYLRLLEILAVRLRHDTPPSLATSESDMVMPDYIQQLLDKDVQQATAARTVSTLFSPLPGLRHKPTFGLPLVQTALAGLRKQVPELSRRPLPREAMLFLAHRLLQPCHAEAALHSKPARINQQLGLLKGDLLRVQESAREFEQNFNSVSASLQGTVRRGRL